MEILPLKPRLRKFLTVRNLRNSFEKQAALFAENPFHPGLHTELLEPKHLHFYSFRLTRKYRVIFIYQGQNVIEVIDINNHYQ